MNVMHFMAWILCPILVTLSACTSPSPTTPPPTNTLQDSALITSAEIEAVSTPIEVGLSEAALDSILLLHDSTWVDIELLAPDIIMDLRYATTNNFMELQIYDCPKCFLRLKAARELLNAQAELKEKNLGFKMYDCYRPKSAQYKLWQKKPDPRFVSPPSRGSMHSRGGALDLTLVDLENGQELDMGTEYDFFGYKAYWINQDLPQEVLDNRQLLLKTMQAHGFKTVTTEWWHFSYRRAWFNLSDMEWDCAS